jgi:hypothetical protein
MRESSRQHRKPLTRKERIMVECSIILRVKDVTEGLGTFSFQRVPVQGEFVALKPGQLYRVKSVLHMGFGEHQPEVYVTEADAKDLSA